MKYNLKEKISDIFEIPQDALQDIPKITFLGNEIALIENHHGIRIYDENGLTVNTTLGFFKIKGRNLFISRFDENYIVLEGEISSMYLGVEDKDG